LNLSGTPAPRRCVRPILPRAGFFHRLISMPNGNGLLAKIRAKAGDGALLIGRRGLSEEYPENTVVSFEAAVEAGCAAVELDVRTTLDGELVCSHDEDLWRCVNLEVNPEVKGLRISDITLKEARGIDVGGWKGPRFAGLSMPTLEEALDAILPRAIPVIERKTGTVGQLLRVLEKKQAIDRVVVCDFDWSTVADMRTRVPGLVVGANGMGPFDSRNLRRLSEVPIINWGYYGLTRADAAAIREAGFLLWTWTINHDFEFQDSLAMGATGIISDHPKRLKKLV
jgi:glycerophosphoryl diester phosphodiesterase